LFDVELHEEAKPAILDCLASTAESDTVIAIPSVCVRTVCPSVTRWYCIKTAEPIITQSTQLRDCSFLKPKILIKFQWHRLNWGNE